MPEVFKEDEAPFIPYPGIKEQLFAGDQVLIPFLGAGASLRRKPAVAGPLQPPQAQAPATAQVCDLLGLKSEAGQRIMDLAVRAAQAVEGEHRLGGSNPFERAKESDTPPSAGELADALAALARYETFDSAADRVQKLLNLSGITPTQRGEILRALRAVAELTGIASTSPPLTSVAGYCEYALQRNELFKKLYEIFEPKTAITPTHGLAAKAARFYLDSDPLRNYLVLSTNYDQLIETAFDQLNVPFCVLTVAKNDWRVDVKFSTTAQAHLGLNDKRFADLREDVKGKYPNSFVLPNRKPLAVLFKIHGTLFPAEPGRDSIIISDEDYIDYIYRMAFNEGIIPMEVVNLMIRKAFLFLGYSFADWNVRGIHRRVIEKRTQRGSSDYAVVNWFNPFERRFFDQYQIHVLQTDLDTFCQRLN